MKFQVLFDLNVDSYYLLSIRDKTGLNFEVHRARIYDILETVTVPAQEQP